MPSIANRATSVQPYLATGVTPTASTKCFCAAGCVRPGRAPPLERRARHVEVGKHLTDVPVSACSCERSGANRKFDLVTTQRSGMTLRGMATIDACGLPAVPHGTQPPIATSLPGWCSGRPARAGRVDRVDLGCGSRAAGALLARRHDVVNAHGSRCRLRPVRVGGLRRRIARGLKPAASRGGR
jgi:hypothetical protein